MHPNLAQAKAGFADEEARGVPADAPHRNYKDANHKPELICALTPFDGLCGFRDPGEAAELLAALEVDSLKPYVDILHAHPESRALREVLTAVLTADPEAMAETVQLAAVAAERLGALDNAQAPAYAAYASIARHYPDDPGVIAAMLLNLVRLQPGEGLYLGAGVPHAYLDGLAVEIMANSDNVLRCGLTPKHVDVPELLRVVRFESGVPAVLRPEADSSGEELYATPIDEFRLSRYVLADGAEPRRLPAATPQILLCVSGAVSLRGAFGVSGVPGAAGAFGDSGQGGELRLAPGQSAFVPAGEEVVLAGAGTVFRATLIA